jgi:predicted Zn-dependent peptidase
MFRKAHLDNGMTVVMEQMKNLRSVTLGIWVRVGSRNEPTEKNGISHFLEHMFFKGTRKRTAREIAIDIDSLGGEMNAFTSKEGTTFYVKMLDEYLERGVELLTDVFLNPTFPEEEVEREKEVVSEEINMVEDTPDDLIHDLFSQCVWGAEGLGQTVLGRRDTVRSFSREDLSSHIGNYYGTTDIVVACAGNFDEERLLGLLNGSLGRLERGSGSGAVGPTTFHAGTSVFGKELTEAHICLGVGGIRQASPERYCLLLLNTVLGGGISSRLFQEIREKRGLAYSVYSFISSYFDTGLWGVYVGTGKRKVNEVVERTARELHGLHETLNESELQRAKEQLKGNIILGLESTSRRMQNIASQEIYYGRYYSPAEIMKAIDSVTLGEARGLAERLTNGAGVAMTVLGPVKETDLEASVLRP